MLDHSVSLEICPASRYSSPWPVLKVVAKVVPSMAERSAMYLEMPSHVGDESPPGRPVELPVHHWRDRSKACHCAASFSLSAMSEWTKSAPRVAMEFIGWPLASRLLSRS